MGGGDGHEAGAGVALVLGGVDDIPAVQVADVGGGGGAAPGHVGVGHDQGRADGGDDFHRVVEIIGQDGVGDHHVVAQLVVEQGAHGAVDEAGDEDAPLGGTALAAVEAAGDAAHGEHALLHLDGQGEVVKAHLGQGGSGDGAQYDGVAVAADGLGVGQLGHLAHLHGEGAAANVGLKNAVIRKLLMRYHRKTS